MTGNRSTPEIEFDLARHDSWDIEEPSTSWAWFLRRSPLRTACFTISRLKLSRTQEGAQPRMALKGVRNSWEESPRTRPSCDSRPGFQACYLFPYEERVAFLLHARALRHGGCQEKARHVHHALEHL